jgi:lysophospholipid acyltransferase (LPLAT)-like uncharacterized protein
MSGLLRGGISSLVKTLRYNWHGPALPERAVIAFWHSKMLAGWWLARKNAVALVSKSKDGDHLARILQGWKYELVRGSSSTGGREALDAAIASVREGRTSRLVVTPDGPRGPKEVMKRGVFIAARELEVPLIFLSITYSRAKILRKSWDHFEIPYPLSSVSVIASSLDVSGFPESSEEQKAYLEHISSTLRR